MLCPHCKSPDVIPSELHELIDESNVDRQIFKAVGCDSCNNTGYSGKTLIVEYLPATAKLRQMVIDRKTYREFFDFARSQGVKTLEEISLDMMLNGDISADEFMRLF